MRPLRLGILGTGVAANKLYLPQLTQMGRDIQLVACANRTRAKAEAFAEAAGIPLVLNSGEDLLAQPQVEAVLISLPILAQPAWVLKALRAGKHVLSEKPLAADLDSGRSLLKAAAPHQKKGLRWMVGENYGFMPHVRQLERWLKQGVLGDVRVVEARQINRLDDQNPYFRTPWRAKPGYPGGFVLDAGIHIAHVLRRCFGLPAEIKRITALHNPALKPMDTLVAVLRFKGGVVGTWTSCFSAQSGGPWLLVRGAKADAELHTHQAVLKVHGAKARAVPVTQDSFHLQFRHFAQAVVQGRPLEMIPGDALADLAFMQGLLAGRTQKI